MGTAASGGSPRIEPGRFEPPAVCCLTGDQPEGCTTNRDWPLDWKNFFYSFDRFKAEHRRIRFLHDYR